MWGSGEGWWCRHLPQKNPVDRQPLPHFTHLSSSPLRTWVGKASKTDSHCPPTPFCLEKNRAGGQRLPILLTHLSWLTPRAGSLTPPGEVSKIGSRHLPALLCSRADGSCPFCLQIGSQLGGGSTFLWGGATPPFTPVDTGLDFSLLNLGVAVEAFLVLQSTSRCSPCCCWNEQLLHKKIHWCLPHPFRQPIKTSFFATRLVWFVLHCFFYLSHSHFFFAARSFQWNVHLMYKWTHISHSNSAITPVTFVWLHLDRVFCRQHAQDPSPSKEAKSGVKLRVLYISCWLWSTIKLTLIN